MRALPRLLFFLFVHLVATATAASGGGDDTGKWKQREFRGGQAGIQLSADHVFDSGANTTDEFKVDGHPWAPVLIVTCSDSPPKGLYVGLATPAASQPSDGFPGYATVLVRYDRKDDSLFVLAKDMGKAVVLQGPQNDPALDGLNWRIPDTPPADKSPSAYDQRFLQRLGKSQAVLFCWTPKDGKMLIFDFDVRGFAEAVKTVQQGCQK
jgi:hypothetical protein